MADLAENNNVISTLRDRLLKHFRKAAGTFSKNLPLQVGQEFQVIAAESLGEGEGASEIRSKRIGKALGDIAISAAMTLEAKALISIAVTALLPAAAASVALPVAIGLLTTGVLGKDFIKVYKKIKKHHQKCKEAGMLPKEALFASIKEHRLEAGALFGAIGLSAIGLGQGVHEFTLAIAGSQEIAAGAGGSIADGVIDTAVAGGERVLDRKHKEFLIERVDLAHNSLTDTAPKKIDIAHSAKTLKDALKRFATLPRRKVNKPAQSTQQATPPRVLKPHR